MASPPVKIITTEDGSHSVLRTDLNETYHSFHGAWGESSHVFIQEGLKHWHNLNPQATKCVVFEVGFGTGLNALLAAIYAKAHQLSIDFHTIEPFPLERDIYQHLNYGKEAHDRELLQELHKAPWDTKAAIRPFFDLQKEKTKLEEVRENGGVDVLFFDAFAPSKQVEMWSVVNLQRCANLLNPQGVLTTYCAQGQFKRNLKTVGLEVESLRGAMGKKEMVRANKPG